MRVGCGQLDVAQRWHTKREAVEFIVGDLPAPQVERRRPAAGSDLWRADIGEGRTVEERSAVTAPALGDAGRFRVRSR